MATFADCPGCIAGKHDRHVHHWGKRPDGVIDGDFCRCPGDCADRARPLDVIVEQLTEARRWQGLSLRAVADRADTGVSNVHNWEHSAKAPSITNLRKWARALGYDLVLVKSPEGGTDVD